MKCIRCGHDSRYPDRKDGACPNCRQKFAFEPQRGDRFTDLAFMNAIARVSAQGSVRYTKRNLFYELERMRKPPVLAAFLVSGLFVAMGCVALVAGEHSLIGWLLLYGAVIAALFGTFNRFARRRLRLSDSEFDAAFTRFERVHGWPPGLFLQHLPAAPSQEMLDELEHYSFDRAVITDRRETAEVLLANGFHFENNCGVLSFDGYPSHAFSIVRSMLRNNPKIEVYALHDCTPEGCKLAWKLRQDPLWFNGVGQVFDVAIRPGQAEKLKASFLPGKESAPHPALSDEERKFMRRHTLELSSLRPEQLVKRLFRSMTLLPAALSASQASESNGTWSVEATASDGGGDSFG